MTTYDEENFVSNSSITLETPEVEKLRPRICLLYTSDAADEP